MAAAALSLGLFSPAAAAAVPITLSPHVYVQPRGLVGQEETIVIAVSRGRHSVAASYVLAFGDGRQTRGHSLTRRVLSHEYNSAGSYRVALLVVDNHGRHFLTSAKVQIRRGVSGAPVAPVAPVKAPASPVAVSPVGVGGSEPPVTAPAPVVSPVPDPGDTGEQDFPADPSLGPPPRSPQPSLTSTPRDDGDGEGGVDNTRIHVSSAGSGIAGILVSLVPVAEGSPTVTASGRTDAFGVFTASVPAGAYTAYVNVNLTEDRADNAGYSFQSVALTPTSSVTAPASEVALAASWTIEGQVVDASGTGQQATVNGYEIVGQSIVHVSTQTDSSGLFTLTGLTRQRVFVAADPIAGNQAGSDTFVDPARLTSPYPQVDIPFVTLPVTTSSEVTGIVQTATGTASGPIGFVYEGTDTTGNAEETGSGVTDASGGFSVGQVPPGTYTVYFNTPDGPDFNSAFGYAATAPITVTSGQSLQGGTVTLPQAGAVSGVVSNVSGPVANSTVSIVTADGFTFQTTTDANGYYRLGGLPAGTFGISDIGADRTAGYLNGVVVGSGGVTTNQDITEA